MCCANFLKSVGGLRAGSCKLSPSVRDSWLGGAWTGVLPCGSADALWSMPAQIFQDAGFAAGKGAAGVSVILGVFKLLMTGECPSHARGNSDPRCLPGFSRDTSQCRHCCVDPRCCFQTVFLSQHISRTCIVRMPLSIVHLRPFTAHTVLFVQAAPKRVERARSCVRPT